MPTPTRRPARPSQSWAALAFVSVYLSWQLVYPALAWFRPGFDRFTWQMFAGHTEHPRFEARLADGSTRDAGTLLRRDNPVRLFGPSVDQERFVPPRLCQLWPGTVDVRVRYVRTEREVVVPCP